MSTPTSAQQRAIAARGNVLLEAGAGAGKTSTLVARCLARVLDEEDPVSLDQVLMVTFTEAAATEMRHRIRDELGRRLAAGADSPRLAEQAALLDQAHIGTLHGFCLRLIREHFQELALDPQLRVLDESEARLLADETLRELLDGAYAGDDDFARGVRDFLRVHGDGREEPVAGLVLAIHRFTRTLPRPDRWFADERRRWANPDWEDEERRLLSALVANRDRWLELVVSQPEDNHAAARMRRLLESLDMHSARTDWAVVLREIAGHAGDDHWQWGEKGRYRDPLLPLIKEAAFFASLAHIEPGGEDPLLADARLAQPHMLAALDLADRFGAGFAARKRQQSALDFSDLEQFALQLLRDPDGGPSTIAHAWRRRLREVFVDEYQDINEAQDSIIAALGGEGNDANRFLVGDVKQSIYGFRLAQPDIFLRHARAWRTARGGQVLPLAENFRSHEAILEFINACFGALFRPQIGGIVYDKDAALKFGDRPGRAPLTRAHDAAPRVELIHRQKTGRPGAGEPVAEEEEEDQTNAEKEALLVAGRLAGFRAAGVLVYDRSRRELRPVRWGDMAILLRASAGKAEVYTRVFAQRGIPLVAGRRGFFDAIEVSDLVSLLMLLDNPLQDIPLLAVLRSPLVGLSPDELVAIRVAAREAPAYWTAVGRFVELHRDASDAAIGRTVARLEDFLGSFGRWRERARRGGLAQCLEDVLDTTCFLSWLGAQERGDEAARNVQRLLDLAREHDAGRGHGLHRFLEYIRLVRDEGDGPEPAAALPGDAVRLMTIHASKGLEFPVVVLADLGKRFRLDSPVAGVVLDEHLGLCPALASPVDGRRYPSLSLHVASQDARARAVAEELRLLYVAFTRACDRLVLVGITSDSRPEKLWKAPSGSQLDLQRLLGATSFFDFLGPLLPGLCADEQWFAKTRGVSSLVAWQVVTADEMIPKQPVPEPEPDLRAKPVKVDLTRPHRAVEFQYPFLDTTRHAGKTTVTRLRKQLAGTDDDEVASLFGDTVAIRLASRPGNGVEGEERLSAARVGIAYHTFFQRMDLAAAGSLELLVAERERLVGARVLSGQEAAAIELERVLAFWTGPVGAGFLSESDAIWRELAFTAAFTTAELDTFAGRPVLGAASVADQVIVQGVVDLVLIRTDEIWILDFKSDRIPETRLSERVTAYRPQVQLYQRALQRTCGRPVSRLWLHFLDPGRSVEVELV